MQTVYMTDYVAISTCFINNVYTWLCMKLPSKDKVLFVSVISLIGTWGAGSLKPIKG